MAAKKKNSRRANTERLLKQFKGRPRLSALKRGRPVRVSPAVQARYKKRLSASNNQYKKQVDKVAAALLKQINSIDRSKDGDFQNQIAKIQKRVAGLTRNLAAANKRSIKAVEQFVNETEKENKKRVKASFSKVDTDLAEALLKEKQAKLEKKIDKLKASYVESIVSANQEYSNRVQRALYEKLANPSINARKRINKAKGVVTRRITNTVKNQGHELNATANSIRQRALGAKLYAWITKEDSAVRDSHAAVHKTIFRYGVKPAATNYHEPGEDHGCRCIAMPIFEEIEIGTKLR